MSDCANPPSQPRSYRRGTLLSLLAKRDGATVPLGSRRSTLAATLALVALAAIAPAAQAGEVVVPVFSKVFSPDTIGPGSVSMLTFKIDNRSGGPVGDLAFTDTLPGGVDLAAPAFVSNTCSGTVTAPDDGDTITLAGGMVGSQICTIVVNVTAAEPGEGPYSNTTGDLTSSAGNSGSATDDLTVDSSLPGFSKSFAPSPVAFGGRSTLTFTIDNSLSGSLVGNLDFIDTLPLGMVVANPSNKTTDCVSKSASFSTTLTAVAGSSSITLDANGVAFSGSEILAAGESCSVTVDVVGGAVGSLGNVSGNLLAEFVEVGKAAAVLEVTGAEDLLELRKQFIDDPVAPGGTVTLELTVINKSRDDAATAITFSDTLDPMGSLTGVVPTLPPTPNPPCGPGSSLAFASGVLTLTGGTLPLEGSCTFSVALSVPAGATPGSYLNTAGPVSGDVGGEPETGNTAGDLLFVVSFPVLTKEFTDDPVAAGDSVTLEFTITNPATSAMSGITFVDELTDNTGALGVVGIGNGFLPFPVSVTLPPIPDPPCGAGSSLALVSVDTDREGLELTGGNLAAGPGTSCTFSVTLDIPLGLAGGTYLNTTDEITGTVAAATVVGPPASDSIVVVSAPTLTKEFTDDPVLPSGGTVTLELNLSYDPELPADDATAIAFTDDLTALSPAVPGLAAASVDTNTCPGAAVDISTPTLIDVSGGTLTPGSSCVISLTLTVPAASPIGFHTNTISDVTAIVGGVAAASNPAEDDLLITPLVFTKAFTGDPVIAGGTATLSFTLDNTTGTDDVTGIFFTDNLAAALPGLAATLPPTPSPPCGAGSSLIGGAGDTFLTFTGGVTAGASCTFSVTVTVPTTIPDPPGPDIPTPDDTYLNTTSVLSATIGGSGVSLPPAVDGLTVTSNLLALTKAFTDDPVNPGDQVTLEFTLTNLDPVNAASAIAFSDNLGDAGGTLLGLEAQSPALFNDCGGMATLPATTFSYSGGSLTGGATCTIRLSLDVPAGPISGNLFPNTTSGVTGTILGLPVTGAPASDDLKVNTVTFSKAFDGPTTAGGTALLTFTLTNLDASNAVSGLAFSDNLAAVISGLAASLPPTPNPPCGAGSALSGTSFLAFTGGSLAPAGSAGDSCSFALTVTVPAAAASGSFLNTTSNLVQSGLPTAAPATALLTIEPPPTFAKSFAPDIIGLGLTSKLTLTIDNTANALAASSLAFTDNLPAGMVIAAAPPATNTCGGTLTAMPGTMVVSLTGGTVAAGGACMIVVDVVATASGALVNTTGDLTSSSGNSGTASATLTVGAPPVVTAVATAAGPLAACDTVRLPVAVIDVTIMGVAPAILNAGAPASYLLVEAGPNGDFATTVCGGAAGDDVEILIVSLSLVGSNPVTASLRFPGALGAGLYRLLVCDVITDSTGTALDGDGDNVAGGDFVLSFFRADPGNLFDNGHFDDCPVTLDPWVTVATPPNAVLPGTPGADDAVGSPLSASAHVAHSAAGPSALGQCLPIAGGADYDLRGQVRFDPPMGALALFDRTCQFFAGTVCSGASLGQASRTSVLEDEGGAWLSFGRTVPAPAGAASVLCDFAAQAVGSDPNFDLYLDRLFFGERAIFTDGFESGDTSRWSAAVP